ncbi:MAG: hypothetical protein AAF928_07070 [Myxococcota bacterium]
MNPTLQNKLRGGLVAAALTVAGIAGMAGPMSDPGPVHPLGRVVETDVIAMTNAAHRDVLFANGYELTAPIRVDL